jgi:glucose-6-phosphate 1-dehydrogenase
MRPEEVVANTVRGQYRTYRDEIGVARGSTTATFAAVRHWRLGCFKAADGNGSA